MMDRHPKPRRYGKAPRKVQAAQLFAELPKSPSKREIEDSDPINAITNQLKSVNLDSQVLEREDAVPVPRDCGQEEVSISVKAADSNATSSAVIETSRETESSCFPESSQSSNDELRVLTWDDVCPSGDRIEKIAEASYAEVYRISNDRGTSIIKVIRLDSPIKPQTKAQEQSGLVDEEPHSEEDLVGELKISEWLADVPGFVVYKERYIVQGKASKTLLKTHQAFHRKAKRKDPDRLQFYPSPNRYLDGTRFLVVELGDAGTALEDFELRSADQLWDIFFHTAIALARAEDLVKFEHRDLHEGNLCIRVVGDPQNASDRGLHQFGHSGLDITILDYGLSRAQDMQENSGDKYAAVAYDLERDLSIFTSTHAPQCKVYRQMRSFLLKGDRVCLPPEYHTKPYDQAIDGPISWSEHHPYTNVLWLAYLYQYLTTNFLGERKDLARFKRITKDFWLHLNPDAPREVLSFSRAGDVVRYAVEAGWITEEQLVGDTHKVEGVGDTASVLGLNESIIELSYRAGEDDPHLRRSPRRHRQRVEDETYR
ncbi:hypothetical protein VTK73DRAFT_2598 [Phialemonium thermophilum]|uniref:non-specific serine/threonine protein kinase n=1 Tax=Phialemonium thermophilum TaxID=223376 RepID=A0ABR3X459_9PEZI